MEVEKGANPNQQKLNMEVISAMKKKMLKEKKLKKEKNGEVA